MPDAYFGEAAVTPVFIPVVPPACAAKTDEPPFDAVATPNDSGTRHGRVLFVAVLTACFATTLFAWPRLGAWPMASGVFLTGHGRLDLAGALARDIGSAAAPR